jgi:hypothetical protein
LLGGVLSPFHYRKLTGYGQPKVRFRNEQAQ